MERHLNRSLDCRSNDLMGSVTTKTSLLLLLKELATQLQEDPGFFGHALRPPSSVSSLIL